MSDDPTRMSTTSPAGDGPGNEATPTHTDVGEVTRTHAGANPGPETPEAAHPAWIGPYAILGVLGMGGMGVVYKARQDRPSRLVALKVIRSGFHDAKLLRRFEMEGEAHGRLHHPGIAQIYEVGQIATPQGEQPFFAMEYIQGRPITIWAGERSLDARARLALVASICDAVQHAHQRGVIHRDLKPDNILVDESGQVKILDFGLARVTAPDLQLSTQLSLDGMVMGTLPYMAPEQASGRVEEIDTRCDIYALGVIAYELLSGRKPLDLKGQVVTEALRIIRESEPPRLSAILPLLRGDVETIVAKALEKDKERRYASASDLASDIRKHLSDQPIGARPPSRLYVLGKFARRHKVMVAAAAAVLATLVAGIVGTTFGLLKAHRANGLAETRRQEAVDALVREQAERVRAEEETRRATHNYGRALKQAALVHFERGESHAGKVLLARARELLPEEDPLWYQVQDALHPEFPRRDIPRLYQHGSGPLPPEVCVADNGEVAFVAEPGGRLFRLDTRTGARQPLPDADLGHIYSMSCSANGAYLAVGNNLGDFAVYDVSAGTRLQRLSLPPDPGRTPGGINYRFNVLVAVASDGSELAVHSPLEARKDTIRRYVLPDMREKDPVLAPAWPRDPFVSAQQSAAIGNLIQFMAFADGPKFLLLGRRTGADIVSLSGNPNAVRVPPMRLESVLDSPNFAFDHAPDNRQFVLARRDGLRLFANDILNDRLVPVAGTDIRQARFVGDGRFVAFSTGSGTYGLAAVDNGRVLASLPCRGNLAAPRQGGYLLVDGWIVETGALADAHLSEFGLPLLAEKQYPPNPIPEPVTSLLVKAPLPEGVDVPGYQVVQLASPPHASGRRAYATLGGQIAVEVPGRPEPLAWFSPLNHPRHVQLLGDGSILLVLHYDQARQLTAERVNLETRQSIRTLLPLAIPTEVVVAVTGDDRLLVLVHVDGSVRIYSTETLEFVAQACTPSAIQRQIMTEPGTGDVLLREDNKVTHRLRLNGVHQRPLRSYRDQVGRLGYRVDVTSAVWADYQQTE